MPSHGEIVIHILKRSLRKGRASAFESQVMDTVLSLLVRFSFCNRSERLSRLTNLFRS
jgi:hypothetical protein